MLIILYSLVSKVTSSLKHCLTLLSLPVLGRQFALCFTVTATNHCLHIRLSLHPLPSPSSYPTHLLPPNPSSARLQAPWNELSISFVIVTFASSTDPDMELMLIQHVLNEWISGGRPVWRPMCHCSRLAFITLVFPFGLYMITWLILAEDVSMRKKAKHVFIFYKGLLSLTVYVY